MPVEIVPFHPDMIPQAGELLAQRHQADRRAVPQLPKRFEDPKTAAQAVSTAWKGELVDGAAAVLNNQLVGYMIGQRIVDPIWGRAVWMRLPGYALAPDRDIELVRHLYAYLGADWVKQGFFFHFNLAHVADITLVQAWFSLSFGIEQVHSVMDLTQAQFPEPELPQDVEIRRAGPGDGPILADLSDVIWRHQVQAPVWGIHLPESDDRSAWAELADDPSFPVWLAFYKGEPIGCQGYYEVEPADDQMLIGEKCMTLTIAGTREKARGLGIGKALTHSLLRHAQASGFQTCETDWRSANLQASRFWPRRGFPSTVYRLVRRIDARIAWAN